MVGRSDPVAQRWLLGGEIARRREDSGLSLADAASASGLKRAKLGHWETGRHAPSKADLRKFLEVCAVPEEDVQRLQALLAQTHGKPWWARWDAVVSSWLGLYLGLEGMAASMFAYEPVLIPGILQTEDYANELTTQAILVRGDDVERFVDLRLARAARLTMEPTLNYHVVIEEAAFHRRTKDVRTMVDQCDHLLEIGSQDNVIIQILRSDRGLHPATSMGQYVILDFEGMSGVVYRELYDDAAFIRDADKLRSYRLAADHAMAEALSAKQSQAFIAKLKKELK